MLQPLCQCAQEQSGRYRIRNMRPAFCTRGSSGNQLGSRTNLLGIARIFGHFIEKHKHPGVHVRIVSASLCGPVSWSSGPPTRLGNPPRFQLSARICGPLRLILPDPQEGLVQSRDAVLVFGFDRRSGHGVSLSLRRSCCCAAGSAILHGPVWFSSFLIPNQREKMQPG